MQRIPEPELMDEAEQARAYALADFAEPNERFVGYFEAEFPDLQTGSVLDLGCGPGDIVLRLATRRTGLTVHGIDGSAAMLQFASERLHEAPELGGRVQFIEGRAAGRHAAAAGLRRGRQQQPAAPPARSGRVLARGARGGRARRSCAGDGPVPAGIAAAARAIVDQYAAGEPEVLRHDFFASLCAAFEPDEIRAQLRAHGLDGLQRQDRLRPAPARHGPTARR